MALAESATLDADALAAEQTENGIDMDALDASERRAVRARTEGMIVLPQTDADGRCIGMYEVFSESGSRYTVDLDRAHGCTCPDTEYRQTKNCKHRRRVALEITFAGCPAPGREIGDYADTLDHMRTALERQRERLFEDIERLTDLISPLED